MSKPFKIGFIGAGAIARTHVENLQKIQGVEIVAASDVNAQSLAFFKDQYKVTRLYSDYKEMLKQEKDLDAVDVCTPNAMHAPATVAALEAGLHVMVEKPMAMNVIEAQTMLETAKKFEKQLVIGFQFRFDPRTKVIRDQIERGNFGRILYVRAQWLRRRGIPNWGVFGRKDLQGGGPMIDIGVHVMETAHYMLGAPKPVSATGNIWTYLGNKESNTASQWPKWDFENYTVEDLAVGMVRFDGGAMMTVETSFVSHIEKDIWNIQVFGEKGGAVWDNVQIFADHGGYMMNMTPAFIPTTNYWEYKMRHFVEVCRDGRNNESSGEHGLMIQKMLNGIYTSAATGREVAIE